MQHGVGSRIESVMACEKNGFSFGHTGEIEDQLFFDHEQHP
jgi:hypothetical protein